MPTHWVDWIKPVAILVASLFVGFWLRRFLLPRLLRLASRTRWEADDIVLRAVQGPVLLWSVMAGVYIAMKCSQAPVEIVDEAGRTLKALWIFSVAWVIANAASQVITRYAAKRQMALPITSLTQHLAKVIILSVGVLMILDTLGVRIASLLAALGIGSLAVALGLQDTLANLFAGFYVTLSKNIRVGDYIKLESGEEGHVRDIGWRATKIHMLSNAIVIVPNAKLSQSVITNYDLPSREWAVLVALGVDYASDLNQVERVTCEVAREVMRTVPGGMPNFEPMVRYQAFADSSIQLTVIMQASSYVDQFLIKHEFLKRLHVRYAKERIAIPFPVRTVLMKSGV